MDCGFGGDMVGEGGRMAGGCLNSCSWGIVIGGVTGSSGGLGCQEKKRKQYMEFCFAFLESKKLKKMEGAYGRVKILGPSSLYSRRCFGRKVEEVFLQIR